MNSLGPTNCESMSEHHGPQRTCASRFWNTMQYIVIPCHTLQYHVNATWIYVTHCNILIQFDTYCTSLYTFVHDDTRCNIMYMHVQ